MKKILIIASLLMGLVQTAALAAYENLNVQADSAKGELTVSGEVSGIERNEPVKLIVVKSQSGYISERTLVCTNEVYTENKKSFSFSEKLPVGFANEACTLYLVSDNGGIYTQSIGTSDEGSSTLYEDMSITIDNATGELSVDGVIVGLERNEPVKVIILKPESDNLGASTLIGTNEMYTKNKKSFSFSETLPEDADSGKYQVYIVSETGGIYKETVDYIKPGDMIISELEGVYETGVVTYQAEIYNDAETAKAADVIVAAYDSEDLRLVGVDVLNNYTLNAGTNSIADAKIICNDGTPAKIRLFVMDSELTPLCGALSSICK